MRKINVYYKKTSEFLYTMEAEDNKQIIKALQSGDLVEVFEYIPIINYEDKEIKIDEDGYANLK